jgi:hypothetical protein
MRTDPDDMSADVSWLDAHGEVSFAELARLSGFAPSELHELVDFGALAPANLNEVHARHEARWVFSSECVMAVRTASRLRASFDLDISALALALSYLGRIRALEAELAALRARLPRSF